MNNDTPIVATFRSQLQMPGADFVCNNPLPGAAATVFFLGPFQGQTVLWNMTLSTLDCLRENSNSSGKANMTGLLHRPFIEIHSCHEGQCQLSVGLALPLIDEQVIKKSIIMIRNYKRLIIGKIEFGAASP